MATKRLHIHYASLDHYADGRLDDVRAACDRDADIIGFDECNNILNDVRTIAHNNGYQAIAWAGGEEALLVKNAYPIYTNAHLKVSNPVTASPARYVSYVGIKWNGLLLMPHIAHWIVHVADHQAHIMTNSTRVRENYKITEGMIRQMHLHGTGNHVALMMGDTNIDEQADNQVNNHMLINYNFRKGNLITIWDEMRVYPNTHANTTYDMVGKYDPYNRVKAVRYKVWPKQHSDHRPVSGWYDINTAGAVATSASGTGSPALPTKNYQWWDYSDYLDNTVYELQEAVDDSGDPDA